MRFSSVVLALGLVFAVACDDDSGPTGPRLEAGAIVGTVTDVDGDPVDGAAIAVAIELESFGLAAIARRAKTQIAFELAHSARVHMEVQDFARERVVIVLVDGMLPAGAHTVVWESDDGDGIPIPPGVYFVVLRWWTDPEGEPAVREMPLVYLEDDPESLVERPRAVTDARGRYRVDLAGIPVGAWIPVADENGLETSYRVSNRVRLMALRRNDAGLVLHSARDVTIADRRSALGVDFVVP